MPLPTPRRPEAQRFERCDAQQFSVGMTFEDFVSVGSADVADGDGGGGGGGGGVVFPALVPRDESAVRRLSFNFDIGNSTGQSTSECARCMTLSCTCKSGGRGAARAPFRVRGRRHRPAVVENY